MPSSPPSKQGKLDGFVKGSTNGKGKEKEEINGSSSISNASSSNKRPRPDGTDVPPEAKKSKASGTHRAFPNGAPDPPEDTVEGLTSILAKLEKVQSKARPVEVGRIRVPFRPNVSKAVGKLEVSRGREGTARLKRVLGVIYPHSHNYSCLKLTCTRLL